MISTVAHTPKRSAKRTVMSWMLVATVFGTTAAACGSDTKTTTTTVASGTGATTAPVAGANADVEAFCTSAADLGKQLKDAMANPTGADVAGITAKATELAAKAAALSSANPSDVARINECAAKLNPAG